MTRTYYGSGAPMGFLGDVSPSGPLESGMTQMVSDQWYRWRQSPRTTFAQIGHGETGWPAESGASTGGTDLCAACDQTPDPSRCTLDCLDLLADAEDAGTGVNYEDWARVLGRWGHKPPTRKAYTQWGGMDYGTSRALTWGPLIALGAIGALGFFLFKR